MKEIFAHVLECLLTLAKYFDVKKNSKSEAGAF